MSDDELSNSLAQLSPRNREVYASMLGEIKSCGSDEAAGEFAAKLWEAASAAGSFEKALCALRKKQGAHSRTGLAT